MTAKEVLIEARRKIENPKNWCQGIFGGDGKPMCASKALAEALCDTSTGYMFSEPYSILSRVMGKKHISDYNDLHRHEEILAKFDEAIQSIEH